MSSIKKGERNDDHICKNVFIKKLKHYQSKEYRIEQTYGFWGNVALLYSQPQQQYTYI